MNTLQKAGGFAALYMAVAYVIGIVLFLFILDIPSITEPAQKVTLLVDQQMVIYLTNLIMYVVFGIFLIVLSLSLYERLGTASPVFIRTATALGIIWAGLLIASGMVANQGIAPVVALYAKDPAQAALTWLAIESVTNGLSFANGEILGGLWMLLTSWAALQVNGLPKWLNYWGLLVAAMGIVSLVPGLNALVGLFGMSQVLWFIWLGIVLLSGSPSTVAGPLPTEPKAGVN